MRIVASTIGLIIISVASCMAAGCEGQELSAHGPGYYLLRALGSLVVVIGLIVTTYLLLRRFSGHEVPRVGSATCGPVEVLQILPVDAGRRVYLLAVADKAYIVAWSGDTATLLGTMERSSLSDSNR